jgi:hypothetical protein
MFVTVDQGHGWGFRYFHSAWIALPLLGAAALTRKNETGPADDSLNTSDLRAFVTACAVLSLVIGVGQRTAQIHEFISDDLAEVPAYTGSERRVVFIDASTGYYGVDLVQNDPWLRGNVIRMLGQSTAADAAVVHQHFPEFHLVYEDIHGTVWSQAQPTLAATPHRARK